MSARAIQQTDVCMPAAALLRPGVDGQATIAVNARVMVKPEADAPKQPMPGATVRVHLLAGGGCVWQGKSDAQGCYYPQGLLEGAEYLPVGIDRLRRFAAVASGPVAAQRVPQLAWQEWPVTIGEPLVQPLHVVHGTGATVARIASGALPQGISHSMRDGLQGTPTGAPGAYPVTVAIQDANGVREQVLLLRNRLLPLQLRPVGAVPLVLSPGSAMAPLRWQASGGEGPYTWSISAGALPGGLDFADGVLSGTPDVEGDYSFTVRVQDVRAAVQNWPVELRVSDLVYADRWRIYITKHAGRAAAQEIEFFAEYDDANNVAVGGVPTASSQESSTYAVSRAFDGDRAGGVDNAWASGTGVPQWVAYAFAAPVAITGFDWWVRTWGGGTDQTPEDFELQYSQDGGATWHARKAWSGFVPGMWTVGQKREFRQGD